MKVICINDKNRPKRIPPHKWIKEGEIYTVTNAMLMNIQVSKVGIQVAEIELDETCFPYSFFDADRFTEYKETPAMKEVNLQEAEI